MTGATSSPGATGSDTVHGATSENHPPTPEADASKSTVKAAPSTSSSWGRLGYVLPVAIFLILAAAFVFGLQRDPGALPSALIDKPVPVFELPPLEVAGDDIKGLSSSDLTGKVQLVNVFASWCGPCRVEHPILMKMSRDGVPIQGL
ncbi:MAG: redoxin family protein, partial [Geminicoccaceae bacterium]